MTTPAHSATVSGNQNAGITDEQLRERMKQCRIALAAPALFDAVKSLVDLYVANPGTDSEFISCITPKNASAMTPAQRKKCPIWKAWDNARAAIAKATS